MSCGLLAPIVGNDDQLALTLGDAAVFDDAVDLGDDRRILRLARLEQLDHARETTGDVLCLRGFARDLRQHVNPLPPFRRLAPSGARATACGICE
jgi:hypothetical protein